MALAREGRQDEAASAIAPVVRSLRELTRQNHGDRWLPLELASALYAQALADPVRGTALLREAAALVEGLAPQLRPLHDVRQLRQRILAAQNQPK
jgi:hypothetical protein